LPPRRKAAWIIGSVIGWLLFGIVGAVVAILYLVGPRRRMNSQQW
jgi:chromate transport protein ChrA